MESVRPSNYENEQMNKKQRLSLDLPDLSSMLEYKLKVTQSHFKWGNKIKKNNYIYLTVWLCRTDNKEVDPDIKKKLKLELYYQNSDDPIEKQKILNVRDPNQLTIYGSNETIIPIRIEEVSQKHDHKNFNVLIKAVDDYNTYAVKTDAIYVVSVLKSNEIITNENPSDSNQITTSSTTVVANNHLEDQYNDSTTVNTINTVDDEYMHPTMVINNQPVQPQSIQQNIEYDDEQFKNKYIDPNWHKTVCRQDLIFDEDNFLENKFNDSTTVNAINAVDDESIYSAMVINNQPIQEQTSQQNLPEDDESFRDIFRDEEDELNDLDEDSLSDFLREEIVEFNDSTIIDAIFQKEYESRYTAMVINNQPFQQQSSQQNFKFDQDLLPSKSLIRDSSWWWCSS